MSLFSDQEIRVRVLLPLPLSDAYDYICAPGQQLAEGDFVRVPLGPNERVGVVWEVAPDDVTIETAKLKPVLEKIAQPGLSEATRELVDWVARYTLQPAGAVLRMVMNVPDALKDPAPTTVYAPADRLSEQIKMTKARERVLQTLESFPPLSATDLAREAGVSTSVIKGLAEAGALTKVTRAEEFAFETPNWQQDGFELSATQRDAADQLIQKITHCGSQTGFDVTLLDGVPGSGKTEVYFEAVAKALSMNKQVLVLLPEIALSSQWFNRFIKRFGVAPAVWHSDIGQAMRKKTWRAVIRGQAQVIVGARSALFLPFKDLGLIIVDEEHDPSFKQEEGVIYNGRDMAVVRARLEKCPIVLASATPSLETAVNAWAGKYDQLHMPSRHADVPLPTVKTIDLRYDKPASQKWLAPGLITIMQETLARGEQVMLYLNRRGYAPLTLCRSCGHRLQCPNCTAWLVEHRKISKLQCHHCGFSTRPLNSCPNCEAEDSFAACGPGVERLAEEVAEAFPDHKHVIAASDTVTTAAQAGELVRQIEDHEVNILIGTQMIAKGYHFPLLTLVGVVDADLGLAGGDLRAAERTYQLLYQVAGRAGRADKPGQVVLQTFMPDHPVMKALISYDRDRFLKTEANARQGATMPPFGRLAALIISGEDRVLVEDAANALGRNAPHGNGILALGPSEAPLAMIRGRHRFRLLLKCDRNIAIQPLVRKWLDATPVARQVRIQIDIDPYSFL